MGVYAYFFQKLYEISIYVGEYNLCINKIERDYCKTFQRNNFCNKSYEEVYRIVNIRHISGIQKKVLNCEIG